jgi:hypothetical protein
MTDLQQIHIEGRWPWFPNLAEVMDEDTAVLDELAAGAVDDDGGLDVERFVAQGLPTEVFRRQFAGDDSALPFRTALWLLHVQGYWSGVAVQEQFRTFGIARGADELGVAEPRQLGPGDVALLHDLLVPVHAALAGSTDDQANVLDDLLRLEIQWGTIFGAAYTFGFYVPCLQAPPAGAKPDHLVVDPSLVRCSEDALLEITYRDPVPVWIVEAKDRAAAARATNPDRWEEIVAGGTDQADLRDIWRRGFETASYNWGADSLSGWTQTAFDQMLEWNLSFGYPVEAAAHGAIAALTTGDPDEIRQALEVTALLVPMWLSTATGIGDGNGTRPVNVDKPHFAV